MKQLPEDLTQKLLDASETFAGTELDVSIDDVARAAGVPRATLYYYFSGKDDLVAFFLNDKLARGSEVMEKAVAAEGTVHERLEIVVRSMFEAMSEYPVLCTELPIAMRRMADYGETMLRMERTVMQPLKDLLLEGRAQGEFDIPDIDLTAMAIAGAVWQVSFFSTLTVEGGHFDHTAVADALAPMLRKAVSS